MIRLSTFEMCVEERGEGDNAFRRVSGTLSNKHQSFTVFPRPPDCQIKVISPGFLSGMLCAGILSVGFLSLLGQKRVRAVSQFEVTLNGAGGSFPRATYSRWILEYRLVELDADQRNILLILNRFSEFPVQF